MMTNNVVTVVSATAGYSILNNEGEYLLNSAIPNYFPFEKIEVFYLVEGLKTSPENFNNNQSIDRKRLDTIKNPYRLTIYPYLPDPDIYNGQIHEDGTETGTAITYVQLSKKDMDTIKTE